MVTTLRVPSHSSVATPARGFLMQKTTLRLALKQKTCRRAGILCLQVLRRLRSSDLQAAPRGFTKRKTSLRSAHVQKNTKRLVFFVMCSRQESNPHRLLRKEMSYPLNDGSEREVERLVCSQTSSVPYKTIGYRGRRRLLYHNQ